MSFLMWRRIRQAVVRTIEVSVSGRRGRPPRLGERGQALNCHAAPTAVACIIDGMTIVHGIENAGRMAWEVGWALALGFLLSALVQTFAPRRRVETAIVGEGGLAIGLATA